MLFLIRRLHSGFATFLTALKGGVSNPSARMTLVNWAAVIGALEKWRKNTQEAGDPFVSEIAAEVCPGPDKPWAVLVSTILSLRTKDDVTEKTSRALLAKAPDPVSLIRLGEEETARLAYPAGFYRNKAASLQKIAAILIEKYGGKVPSDMDSLLALPGVGRKTANLVLVEAFDKYGICVDIHVHRISNRAGWVETPDPEKTEMRLREILPKRYWKRINNLLVRYGQHLCRPVSPFCSICVIREHCLRKNIGKSR